MTAEAEGVSGCELIVAAAVGILVVSWAASPTAGMASCAATATFEEIAEEPDAAVFTGWATREMPGTYDVEFAVDRWLDGPHASRVVHLSDATAGLVEPSAGVVSGVLARMVAGDAISLVANEPVMMVATWTGQGDVFGVRFCSVAGVPLDSPEGRDALRSAEAVFGPGRPAAELPATDTGGLAAGDSLTNPLTLRDWWPLLLAFALAATLVLLGRRNRGRKPL